MHEALTGLLDTADLALSAVSAVVGEAAPSEPAHVVADARSRLDYPESVIVAALAGGTGSGKSSLFNAITGTDFAPVGEIRPTTSEPVAAVPARHPGAMDGYLDLLGVTRRVEHRDPVLCILDLPDTDSVVTAHRHRVEELMPRLDVLVWVVDPEKYRDAALHHRYLAPLSGYAPQFVFVLNQVDRLAVEEVEPVLADLEAALAEDGIPSPVVVATSVDPRSAPLGVDLLVGTLHRLAERSATLYGKLITDLARAAGDLERAVGRPIGYRALLAPMLDEVAVAMTKGDRATALDGLSRFCDDVAARVGGAVAEAVTGFAARLPTLVEKAVTGLPAPPTPPRFFWQRPSRDSVDRVEVARDMAARMLAPVTGLMTDRARALALVAELAVGAARLDAVVAGQSSDRIGGGGRG